MQGINLIDKPYSVFCPFRVFQFIVSFKKFLLGLLIGLLIYMLGFPVREVKPVKKVGYSLVVKVTLNLF